MPASVSTTKMNLKGLLNVLGDALYSTPDVVLRELVQNAHDSCVRRRLEDPALDAAKVGSIRVTSDLARGTIRIEDTGAGLTSKEVEDYLATVGSGYTRVLRDESGDDDLIGYFGLGFLSTYVVANKVQVWTCSFQDPGQPCLFSSRGGEQYSIQPAAERAVGTEVCLELKDEHVDLAGPDHLRQLLEYYCALIDVPIHCNGDQVNATPPPWRSAGTEDGQAPSTRQCLDFASRFERVFTPLTTHLIEPAEAEAPEDSRVDGLLWIQDGGSYASSDNRHVSLFIRGMLVGEDERELLPTWAGFVGAALESKSLKPTASREALKRDRSYTEVRTQLKDQVIKALMNVAQGEQAVWNAVRNRHNEALLGACLCEEDLLDALGDRLTVPTSEGAFTLPALLRRSGGRIHLSPGNGRGAQELLFRALRVPIVDGSRYAVAPFCRAYCEKQACGLVELGTSDGDDYLLKPSNLSKVDEEALQDCLASESYRVIVRTFEPEFLPFVVVSDEEQRLRERIDSDEADRRIASATLALARLHTSSIPSSAPNKLYLNACSTFVKQLLAASVAERAVMAVLVGPLILVQSEQGDGVEDFARVFEDFAGALSALFNGRDRGEGGT